MTSKEKNDVSDWHLEALKDYASIYVDYASEQIKEKEMLVLSIKCYNINLIQTKSKKIKNLLSSCKRDRKGWCR
jgi:hypothetical protein